MSIFYKLVVKEVNRETPQAISVLFNVPLELKNQFEYVAGQYITLKLNFEGEEIRRAYSICTPPSSYELKICIKAVTNGSFSTFANKNLKVGDIIEVSQPEGRFTFKPQLDKQKNYMAFVAGSGITPVMSILQSVLLDESKSSFTLVYGNKSIDETIFYNQLEELKKKFLGRLTIYYVLSQETKEGSIYGRIDESTVKTIFDKNAVIEYDDFYLCGPETMIHHVTHVLKTKGIAEKNINFELFSTTPTENEVSLTTELSHAKITVILDHETETFDMSSKQTLLEATLKHGIDAPYSCQGGICSSCIAKVKSGSAVMKKNTILTDKEIADGLILTCQSHPTSQELTIDFDDV